MFQICNNAAIADTFSGNQETVRALSSIRQRAAMAVGVKIEFKEAEAFGLVADPS